MKKYLLYALGLLVLAICISLLALTLARPIDEVNSYIPGNRQVTDEFSAYQLDSVNACFSNVEILPEYRDVILMVLAYYPDLKYTNIKFVYSSESTTMASRPEIGSLLMGERTYNVFINNDTTFEGILLADVPRKAQIGVVAHELAHILQYESFNTIGIVQLGLMLMDDDSKRLFERETDERTISRGFGEYLKAWAQYSMFDSPKATQEYKEFKKRIYMSPSEIDAEMAKYSCYSHPSDSL